MKKLSMILSAVLAAAMAVPAVTSAANKYPSNPGYINYDEFLELSEEEQEERHEGWRRYQEELAIGYQNGEYDWDFNLDGVVNTADAFCILVRYAETATDTLKTSFWDTYSSDEDDWKYYEFTDEMREKVIAEGDIDGDGVVDAKDGSWFLYAVFEAEKQGDVDTNGYVDARDASAVLAYYSAMSVGKTADYVTTKNMEYLGDVNGDGKIDAADASAVLEVYSANSVSE